MFQSLLRLLIAMTLASPVAFATNFVVTKTADTNDGTCNADCSLREAIVAANALPGLDQITLGAIQTYTLTLGPADAPGALVPGTGDLDVVDSLTIMGNNSTINAVGLDRVFDIQGNFAVIMNDLKIQNGSASGFLSLGGGISVKNGTLTLNNCTVSANNTASEGGFRDDGGGIAVVGSYDTATATSALAVLTLSNTTVSGNNGLNGGGIICVLCSMVVMQSTITGNTSTGGDGGGVAMVGNSSSMLMNRSAMTSNSVSGGSAQGGGLSVPFGTSVSQLTRNRIVGNAGAAGSAVFSSVGSNITATDNWWGCNYGPGATGVGCSGAQNSVDGSVTTSPHLILKITAPPAMNTGDSAAVTADLTINSSSADTSSGGTIPDATIANFTSTLGTIVPPSVGTSNGKANTVFTAGNTPGNASLGATVDAQTVSTQVALALAPPKRRRAQVTSND